MKPTLINEIIGNATAKENLREHAVQVRTFCGCEKCKATRACITVAKDIVEECAKVADADDALMLDCSCGNRIAEQLRSLFSEKQ